MARAIPGERPTRYRREDHRVGIAEDGSRKSDDSLRSSGVSAIADLDDRCPSATDGEIAAINLESARRRAWARFAQDPRRPGVAEAIVDHERLAAQFLGDLDALDRLDALASQFARVDDSSRAALVQRRGRFDSASLRRCTRPPRACRADGRTARGHRAPLVGDRSGMWRGVSTRCSLRVAESPRRAVGSKIWYLSAPCLPISSASPRRTPSIGRRFTRTTASRRSRWRGSAFSSACCGENWCPSRTRIVAALWYRRAIAYLPGYVKARVHLAEIYASQDQTGDAETLLRPALSSRDPEVRWRLADVLIAQGRLEEAETQLDAARVRLRSSFSRDTCSPSRTMPRSSTPAAATTAGARSNSRARMSRIVRHAVRSSRPMRSR